MSFSIIALHCQSYHFPILSFLLPPPRLLLLLKDQKETFFTFYLCAGHVLNTEFCCLSWFIQDPITVVLQHFSSNKEVDFFQTDSAVLFQFYKKLNYCIKEAKIIPKTGQSQILQVPFLHGGPCLHYGINQK